LDLGLHVGGHVGDALARLLDPDAHVGGRARLLADLADDVEGGGVHGVPDADGGEQGLGHGYGLVGHVVRLSWRGGVSGDVGVTSIVGFGTSLSRSPSVSSAPFSRRNDSSM